MLFKGFLYLLEVLAFILSIDIDFIFLHNAEGRFLIIRVLNVLRLLLVFLQVILQRCDDAPLSIEENLVLALKRPLLSDLA